MGNAPSALVGAIVIAVGAIFIVAGAIAKPNNGLQAFGLAVLLSGLYLLGDGGKPSQQPQPQPIPQDADLTRPDDDEKWKYLEKYRDISLVFAGAIVGIVILSLLDNTQPVPWRAESRVVVPHCEVVCSSPGKCSLYCTGNGSGVISTT